MPGGEKRSPWVWIGVGCAGCGVVLAVIAVVGAFTFVRWGKSLKRDMQDPQARTEHALKTLGTSELPPGYYPGPSFSVPFLMDLAMLVDRPMDERGEMSRDTRSAFIYVNLIRGGRKWRDYVAGRSSPEELLGGSGLHLEGGELLGNGEMKLDGLTVNWFSRRGATIAVREGRPLVGLATLMFLRCPDDPRMRIGVWITPDPTPDVATPEVDLTGSAADPAAIEALLSRFELCS